MNTKPVGIFLLETVLWLPVVFAVWYYAPFLSSPLAWLADAALSDSAWFAQVTQHGHRLEIFTTFQITDNAILSFDVNTLRYSFGLPFLTALLFAAPGSAGRKLRQLILAWLLVLLPAQVLGIIGYAMKAVIFHFGPALSLQVSPWLRESVAVGYQFSTLILPPLTPVAVWLWLSRGYLRALMGEEEESLLTL